MLKNYFKVMVRNLLKRKGFALINLFGLATGMAVCILLVMYIQNELGYDSSYKNADRIYRLGLERKYTTRSAYLGHIPRGIPKAIKTEFPEVLQVTRMAPEDPGGLTIIVGEKNFIEKNVISVDTNFFSVFSAKFLQGDVSSALQKPHTIVVNESTAKRFFGSAENAIGKKIEIERSGPLVVTAVFKDWPEKSHFHADILIPSFDWDPGDPEYIYFGPYTYLLLDKNASAKALEAKLPLVVEKYVAPKVGPLFGESFKDFVAEGNGYRYFLQPIKDIHLHSTLDDEITPTVSIGTIRMFGAIAVFILFLACVNFINLSTALSVERAREVGIRKTFGSQKSALILQFLSESVFFSLASMILALAFVSLLVPFFNKISGTHLSYTYFLHPWNLFFVVLLSVVIGVLAGLYPSLVLSSFEPMIVLKGRFKSNRRGLLLRNGLVIFQFAVSVILIICTIVVNRQMQFMLGEELGYKKDNIVYVDKLYSLVSWTNETGLVDKRQAFVDELSQIPGVNVISKCDGMPGTDDSQGGATWLCIENNNSRTEKVQMVDDNYAKLLGLQIKEGRFFSREFATDSLGVVINEKAAEDLGLKNPIGARLISKEPIYNPRDSSKGANVFTVIGVMKDYHHQSLFKKIAPLIFVNSNKFFWATIGIGVNGKGFNGSISAIGKTWHKFDPKHDINLSFFDQGLANQYKLQQTQEKIFTLFSMLAIIIACVGLLGLATFSSLQRAKEISIRKVLGAAPRNIVMILSKDFLILVAVASIIAFPVAWWAMHSWLQGFAYRAGLSWWIFPLSGLMAAVIAMITISYQAIRSAFLNPLPSLKAE